jgi:hypothetical protein
VSGDDNFSDWMSEGSDEDESDHDNNYVVGRVNNDPSLLGLIS